MTRLRGSPRRRWPSLAIVTAALFLAFVVEQSPHLVHHIFEGKHLKDECAFSSGAERTPSAPATPVTLEPPPLAETALATHTASTVTFLAPGTAGARAPPPVVS